MKAKKEEKQAAKGQCKKEDKKIARLNEQIETLSAEKDEIFEKLQRVSAEFANYQKRMAKQVSDSMAYEKESVIKSILPVLDNFEHTLTGAEKVSDAKELLKVVQTIYEQMISILKNHGIEQLESLGKPFDPATHEAMMQRAEADCDDGIVLQEFRKGYKLGGRVIRPGKVIVNKKAQPKQESDDGRQDVIEEN